ncbi:MAG: family N-acetyltransferase [Frankiales bacterium]|nr:family N-acetyltransferase [Frankiales bacterium]
MIEVRALLPGDVPAAEEMATASLRTMSEVYEATSLPAPDRTPDRVARSRYRIAHLQRTDPDGAWVAVDGNDVVGIALSLRRGPMWFLSLLAVATGLQSRGLGRALLEASLRTADGAAASWILASADPKALRRYALAGFAPHAGYSAAGPVDRALVPSGLDVREGDWARDGELVEDVVTGLRGAPYGPDLEAMSATGHQLLVVERGLERGFAVVRGVGGIASLGATSPALAQQLLWAWLAGADSPAVTLEWLTADQQWAIDVALSARLALLPGPSSCRRTTLGPMTPYLPGGAYG